MSPAQARIPATPAVRRLLREHALDISAIAGSGRNGRVLKEDVLAYLARDSVAAGTTDRPTASSADQRHRDVDPAAAVSPDVAVAEPMACESHEPRAARLEARQVPSRAWRPSWPDAWCNPAPRSPISITEMSSM
ncbi:E3 binding domain-containing protein [Cobetia marina]